MNEIHDPTKLVLAKRPGLASLPALTWNVVVGVGVPTPTRLLAASQVRLSFPEPDGVVMALADVA
jgi:hypothetical protein